MAIRYENGIKRPGQIHQWTEEQVREMVKCSQDPIYFGEKYYKIKHPDRGELTIQLHPFQKDMVSIFQNNQRTAALCPRQVGKTTIVSLYILWYCLFNEHKFVAITAHMLRGAKSVMDDIKFAYQKLPDWIKPGVMEFNATSVKFENGTEIMASPTSADSLRGQSCSLVFCLGGENTITVRNKETGEIQEVSLEDLYNEEAYN